MVVPTHSYVEDITDNPVDPETVLDDATLIESGLVPVRAFIRTKSSKAAIRAKRHRERAEAGHQNQPPKKQLNVMAPMDPESRMAVKVVAEALVEGRLKPMDLKELNSDSHRFGQAVKLVLARGGIRAAVLKRILGKYL